MPGLFICHHCGKILPRNPRLKKPQKYCLAKSCQQARKNAWGKKAYQTSKAHRQKRLQSQKACYSRRRGHAYQADYRKSHPDYANRNRELQASRNQRRRREPVSMIVNTDALYPQTGIDGAYAMMPITKEGKIVNTDAFVVQLRAVAGLQAFLSVNTG